MRPRSKAVDVGPGSPLSPGRIAPTSPAFDLSGTEGVRRSLAAQFRFRGRDLVVVVNHWSSKYADDRAFGARQPPRAPTGEFRLAQAREIRRFAEGGWPPIRKVRW